MSHSVVVALAGRRVDPADATKARFPLRNAGVVRERIVRTLRELGATALVSSAACGADLLALEAAGTLALRRVVVLPFSADRFLSESVADRPGAAEQWVPSFQRVMHDLDPVDVIVLEATVGERSNAFEAANERILMEAARLAEADDSDVVALVVWDGTARPGNDLTAGFKQGAEMRGMQTLEIPTV